LWLPRSTCPSCEGHELYNTANSSTAHPLKKSFNLGYVDGGVNGTLYTDDVTIAGYTAKTQTLGAARQISTPFNIDNFLADGVLGLAFPSLSAFNATPFFQTLAAQGDLPANSFGMYLAQSDSELYLGGTNDKLHKDGFTYVPVTRELFWEANFDALYLNGRRLTGVRDAIIDSGTTQIVGDTLTVKKIYDRIPGSADLGSGLYSVPCTYNSTISLRFGGIDFAIDHQTFNLGPLSEEDSQNCLGGLSAGDGPTWVVGVVFLQNVYTEFDFTNKRIGFAHLA